MSEENDLFIGVSNWIHVRGEENTEPEGPQLSGVEMSTVSLEFNVHSI